MNDNSFYLSTKPKTPDDILIAREYTGDITSKKVKYWKNVYLKEGVLKIVGNINPSSDTHKFCPVPVVKKDNLEAVYISGPSGSGKSTQINSIVRELKQLDRFKKHNIFLISGQVNIDPALKFQYSIINLTHPDFLKLSWIDFKDSITIFDDVSSLSNDYLQKYILKLQESLLENSRKNNTAVISVSHQSSDYNKTRKIIAESSSFVIFPNLSPNQSERFLSSYMSLTDKHMDDIFDLETRPLFIHKQFPIYFVSDKKIGTFEREKKLKQRN